MNIRIVSYHLFIRHAEFSPNFIRHNEEITEKLKQVQHDVSRLLVPLIKCVTLNLFQGLIDKLLFASVNEILKRMANGRYTFSVILTTQEEKSLFICNCIK